ncbi:MAG TPA: carbamoyltransferase HypF [Usitatibacter sp.]|nr:carbamoyltransferase HypF [Usitatibacter sp.]
MSTVAAEDASCIRVRVRGAVQGVGFRPFVHRLARELGLAGWVRNDGQGVAIEAQGPADALRALVERISTEAPALARITAVETQPAPVLARAPRFDITRSGEGPIDTGVTADAAICRDCLRELFDPANRRWRYPFINCTHCGPRYTITSGLPYDRPQTSMARFALCPACRSEYEDPADRRFHAQPNACSHCGPGLAFADASGATIPGADPVAQALAAIRAGGIVAIKGLGGFHLACDARNPRAVAQLRARKNREEKPFAVMLCNVASIGALAECGEREAALLQSVERPVVLLRKRESCDAALTGIAPGLAWLGVMLPYTPVHYLLFHEAAGRPPHDAWLDAAQPLALVMTSANPGGEPIVRDNAEALERLAGIADALLIHDRDIVTRCDDSVVRAGPGPAFHFVRRARGYTPRAIRLARAGPPVLAVGGFLKGTVCLTRGDEAFVSQHIGDLDNAPTCKALEETAARLMELLRIRPAIVAHDRHPDFFSTAYAAELARSLGVPARAVQHHHAHVAAVAAEHRVDAPVIGLALDGVGLGDDGEAWGGELLLVDGARCERRGHLRRIALPGGDRAAREPWRMAAAALHLLGRDGEIEARFPHGAGWSVRHMLEAGIRTPHTSSAGRWFDAAAGLLGVKERCAYEGQAAMLLEALAARRPDAQPLADGFSIDADGVLDLSPTLAWLLGRGDVLFAAATFHATFAEALAQWALHQVRETRIRRVALGGGCFLNAILSSGVRQRLERAGVAVLEASQVPPNDGGLSLGQAWVALRQEGC